MIVDCNRVGESVFDGGPVGESVVENLPLGLGCRSTVDGFVKMWKTNWKENIEGQKKNKTDGQNKVPTINKKCKWDVKGTSNKSLKVTPAKQSFPSMYIIDNTTCFDERFFAITKKH